MLTGIIMLKYLACPCRSQFVRWFGLASSTGAVLPRAPGTKARTAEFRRMNPAAQIPAIDDAGFKLGESMAIWVRSAMASACARLGDSDQSCIKQTLQHIWQRRAAGRIAAKTHAQERARVNVLALPPPHDPRASVLSWRPSSQVETTRDVAQHRRKMLSSTLSNTTCLTQHLFWQASVFRSLVRRVRGSSCEHAGVRVSRHLSQKYSAYASVIHSTTATDAGAPDLACYSELGQLLPQYHNLWDFSALPNLQAGSSHVGGYLIDLPVLPLCT